MHLISKVIVKDVFVFISYLFHLSMFTSLYWHMYTFHAYDSNSYSCFKLSNFYLNYYFSLVKFLLLISNKCGNGWPKCSDVLTAFPIWEKATYAHWCNHHSLRMYIPEQHDKYIYYQWQWYCPWRKSPSPNQFESVSACVKHPPRFEAGLQWNFDFGRFLRLLQSTRTEDNLSWVPHLAGMFDCRDASEPTSEHSRSGRHEEHDELLQWLSPLSPKLN